MACQLLSKVLVVLPSFLVSWALVHSLSCHTPWQDWCKLQKFVDCGFIFDVIPSSEQRLHLCNQRTEYLHSDLWCHVCPGFGTIYHSW
jgi:hypothetical protein